MTEEIARSPLLISASMSTLLIVDVQDKLLTLVPERETVLENLRRLAIGASCLEVPRLAAEQYPEKLGPLSPAVVEALNLSSRDQISGKLSFSCRGCPTLIGQLRSTGRPQVVLAGLETHVCILQTALDLIGTGLDVFLVLDAVGTRHAVDHHTGLRRMESAGVTLVTTESVLFEWCEVAGTPQFKQISQLVRYGADQFLASLS